MNLDWFYQYFIKPMDLGYGYNIVNTFAYALLVVGISYLLFKLMKSLKIRINERFALALYPLIIFGSAFRILEDLSILKGYLFMTPGIWLFFTAIFIALAVPTRINISFARVTDV